MKLIIAAALLAASTAAFAAGPDNITTSDPALLNAAEFRPTGSEPNDPQINGRRTRAAALFGIENEIPDQGVVEFRPMDPPREPVIDDVYPDSANPEFRPEDYPKGKL